ncbi:MAG: carbohydrate porin [Planctomycetaceae bacterium]
MQKAMLKWCVAACALCAATVRAGDDGDLREEVRQLREEMKENRAQMKAQQEEIASLREQRATLLREEVSAYLQESGPWQSSEGAERGLLDRLRIPITFVSVLQATLGNEPADRLIGDGNVRIDFEMQITDKLSGFVHIVANTGPSGNPTAFGSIFPANGTGPFGPIGAPTATGLFDGIDVDGTQSFNASPIDVYQAGIRYQFMVGDTAVHYEVGGLDPRLRNSQNAFADDELTQFLNNSFDDAPAISWITTGPRGTSVFGLHMWVELGAEKQFTVSWGWYNSVAQIFNNGQLYFQFAWAGDVNGRRMNVRLLALIDSYTEASAGEDVFGGGISWDWMATDKVGLFVRINANGGDFNPVDMDASIGAVFLGLIESRPDDTIGVAIGFISLQTVTVGPLAGFAPPEDTELTIEVYYRLVSEGGKFQVTPHLMFISDPAGGVGWTEDTLFILGVRLFVPF